MNKSKRVVVNELREALFRIDELEGRLDGVLRENEIKEKQLNIQNKVIKQLREQTYKCVELNEYQVLKEKFETCFSALTETQNKNEVLNKRLDNELKEIEFLHMKRDSHLLEVNKYKRSSNKYKNIVEKQKLIIQELDQIKESRDYYKKEFEKVLDKNLELNELLDSFKEEHQKMNESNISVDDLTQSISKFWDSFNGNNKGESMDCIIDIKLSDVERALEEKKRINEELQNRINVMNEEIKQMVELQFEFEKKFQDIKPEGIAIQVNPKTRETTIDVKDSSVAVIDRDKESFDKIFDILDQKLLSLIPLSSYFVPIGKRIIFCLIPKLIFKLF